MNVNTEQLVSEVMELLFKKINFPTGFAVVGSNCKPVRQMLVLADGKQLFSTAEEEQLKDSYAVTGVEATDGKYRIDDFDVVVLGAFDNTRLSKLASGIIDSSYLQLASKAILSGKTVFVVQEEVEYYRYQKTSNPIYYRIFEHHLELLVKSGIVVCPQTELVTTLVQQAAGKPYAAADNTAVPRHFNQQEDIPSDVRILKKKVITEKDMMDLKRENCLAVRTGARCILTDLAKEFALKNKIVIYHSN